MGPPSFGLNKYTSKKLSEPTRSFGTNVVAERSLKPHQVAATSVTDNGGQLMYGGGAVLIDF
jgi:hypothetical protein